MKTGKIYLKNDGTITTIKQNKSKVKPLKNIVHTNITQETPVKLTIDFFEVSSVAEPAQEQVVVESIPSEDEDKLTSKKKKQKLKALNSIEDPTKDEMSS